MDAKKLISEDRIEEAIEVIEKDFKNNGYAVDDLLFVKGRYAKYRKKVLRNQMTDESASIERAKITQSLFDILKDKRHSSQYNLSAKRNKRINMILIGVLVALLLVFSLPISGYFDTETVELPSKDDDVTDLVLGDFGKIYPKYRDVYLRKLDENKSYVRVESKHIISKLEIISNDQLEMHSIIYKYIGIALCNKILALTSSNNKDKIRYSSNMLSYLANAEERIQSIKDITDTQYKEDLNHWISEEKHLIRVRINKFIASAINLKANGFVTKEEVKQQLKALDEDLLLKKEGYNSYPIVEWAREHLKSPK